MGCGCSRAALIAAGVPKSGLQRSKNVACYAIFIHAAGRFWRRRSISSRNPRAFAERFFTASYSWSETGLSISPLRLRRFFRISANSGGNDSVVARASSIKSTARSGEGDAAEIAPKR